MEGFCGSPYLDSLIEKYNYVEILHETFDSVIAPEFRKRGFRKILLKQITTIPFLEPKPYDIIIYRIFGIEVLNNINASNIMPSSLIKEAYIL